MDAWLYHRGKWSKINNPLPDTQDRRSAAASRRTAWRRILQEYDRLWINLGPAVPPSNYSGPLVQVYSYTGEGKAPQYLIRIVCISSDEAIYAQDLPDTLEVLTLLVPMVSCGIFTDAYSWSTRK
jgi:hypothetical protein